MRHPFRARCLFWLLPLLLSSVAQAADNPSVSPNSEKSHPPIPVRFTLKEPGRITLVIEDSQGKRVRNLIAETPFPAGENVVWWDGLDDLGRDPEAPRHGIYQIPARLVPPGEYRIRGLVHPPIHLRYEFSVYNAGNPAWETENSRGGWLANHTPPSAVLYLPETDANRSPAAPSPGGAVLVGSYVSEGGHGLAWLDLNGRKRFGQLWVGGVWTGATHLCRDTGPKRISEVYAYTGAAWEGGGFDGPKPELRLAELLTKEAKSAAPRDTRFGKGWDRPLLTPNAPYSGILPPGASGEASKGDFRYVFPDNAHVGLSGLAVYNARLVAALPKMNQLLWVDAKKRTIIGTSALEGPRGVAFDGKGRLLALSGKRLLRYDVGENPTTLPEPKVVIASGLEDPQGMTLDSSGRVYISDWGDSHQVKIFSPEGKLIRAIGHPGAPKAGRYDPLHMNHPKGITLDGQGRLWVAEEDFQPKRVSVWMPDGRLMNAFYGPSEYGGGGQLDPKDRTRFYYHGMEFRLDWKTGKDRLESVFFRPGPKGLSLPEGYGTNGTPETPIYVKGRQYMTNCYNSNPTNGSSMAMIWRMANGTTRPVAAMGRASDWSVLKGDKFRQKWPTGVDLNGDAGQNSTLFVWSDLNGDAKVQPEEVQFQKAAVGGITVMPDLSLVVARVEDRAMRYPPTRFTAGGVPAYDLSHGETLAEGAQSPTSSGGDQALVTEDGRTVFTVGPKPFAPQSVGGGKVGKALWSYPSLWPGLHASHESPAPDRPGELIGTTRLLGGFVTPKAGEAGPLWAINGNMGNVYLFTADGLFVSELFRDVRVGKSWTMPEARRGMLLDGISLHDENFWPSLAGSNDGNIYLVDGARTSLVRVEGLESIRRLPPQPLILKADDLKRAQEWQVRAEAMRQSEKGRGRFDIPILTTPPTLDGKLDDWKDAEWMTVDDRGVAAFFNSDSKPYHVTATLRVAGDRLYAAYRTEDAGLLKNAGDPVAPFKTGGALDLMIGADAKADPSRSSPGTGDERLLVAQVEGKTVALLYRAVVPGTRDPVPFSSPWRTITLDQVEDVSDRVQFAGTEGNFEVSAPLSLLDLKPEPGTTIRGDIGILRGNGFQTLQRVYWNNKATGITSDLPSEAMLTPNLWGEWRFTSP